ERLVRERAGPFVSRLPGGDVGVAHGELVTEVVVVAAHLDEATHPRLLGESREPGDPLALGVPPELVVVVVRTRFVAHVLPGGEHDAGERGQLVGGEGGDRVIAGQHREVGHRRAVGYLPAGGHGDVVARLPQEGRGGGADHAGATDNEDLHEELSFSGRDGSEGFGQGWRGRLVHPSPRGTQPPAACVPPSTWMVPPVTKRARSLARNRTG